MRKDKIIYSINCEDVDHVAQEELGRTLTDCELKIVEHKIGDRFDWYGAIAWVISEHMSQDEPAKSTR